MVHGKQGNPLQINDFDRFFPGVYPQRKGQCAHRLSILVNDGLCQTLRIGDQALGAQQAVLLAHHPIRHLPPGFDQLVEIAVLNGFQDHLGDHKGARQGKYQCQDQIRGGNFKPHREAHLRQLCFAFL